VHDEDSTTIAEFSELSASAASGNPACFGGHPVRIRR
jgi:hypothetical protein